MGRRITPVPEEFEVTRTSVIHKPTGATWTAYADSRLPNWFNPGDLGLDLATGEDYPVDEVIEMGKRLLARRIPATTTT
jgi:hypothetical protein